jgi:hypothetical protein
MVNTLRILSNCAFIIAGITFEEDMAGTKDGIQFDVVSKGESIS